MTALDFPSSPTLGQTYGNYTWDGEKWFSTLGGTGLFSPLTIPGLAGWYDASVTASLTLSGSIVTNIADQSGGSHHLGDGSTGSKPTYNATGFNGKPTLVHVATSNIISTGGYTFPLGTGNTLTFFMAASLSASSQSNARCLVYYTNFNSDWSDARNWLCGRAGSSAAWSLTRATVGITAATSYNTPNRVIGTINSSGLMTLYVNGVAVVTGTAAGNWATPGAFQIGSSISDGGNFAGNVSEVGVATSYSDATMVAKIDTYLAGKWGF